MKTDFASPERAPQEQISYDYALFSMDGITNILLNSIPNFVLIINENRQMVYANDKLKAYLKTEDIENLIGSRPGELVHCVNSTLNKGGCGTSVKCRFCGAINSILESQNKKIQFTDECSITIRVDDDLKALDFRVTTSFFAYHGKPYYITVLEDISHEKRKHVMERIFFHDVMNTASSIFSVSKLIKKQSKCQVPSDQYIEVLDGLSKTLMEEIKIQRDLADAESGKLKLHPKIISSKEIIENIISTIKNNQKASSKKLEINNDFENVELVIDTVLLYRILTNMTLNALEASSEGATVTIGVNENLSSIRFWVRNLTYIPEDVQSQIFSRSFSTKGPDRGLGTYSMKILGENYLKGKVNFTSTPSEGTVFYIDIPKL